MLPAGSAELLCRLRLLVYYFRIDFEIVAAPICVVGAGTGRARTSDRTWRRRVCSRTILIRGRSCTGFGRYRRTRFKHPEHLSQNAFVVVRRSLLKL